VNSDLLKLLIWVVVVAVAFVVLWRKGYLLQVSKYVLETREELRKCTWPSWEELKGSTVVIGITIVLLGGFIVAVDYVVSTVITWIT
jgi:preprotein translocase subunit SecE